MIVDNLIIDTDQQVLCDLKTNHTNQFPYENFNIFNNEKHYRLYESVDNDLIINISLHDTIFENDTYCSLIDKIFIHKNDNGFLLDVKTLEIMCENSTNINDFIVVKQPIIKNKKITTEFVIIDNTIITICIEQYKSKSNLFLSYFENSIYKTKKINNLNTYADNIGSIPDVLHKRIALFNKSNNLSIDFS